MKFLHQEVWHSLVKLRMKNYENPSTFLEVAAKIISCTYYVDTV